MDSGTPEHSQPRGWMVWPALALVLLCAAGVRGAYLVELCGKPDFDSPLLDPRMNDYWARSLVSGDWTPPEGQPDPRVCATPYGRPPAYPHVLAALYAASGGGHLFPRLLQMAVGLVNVVLLFLLGRRLFGSVAGIAAAALGGLYWGFVYFEGELNAPAWVILLCLLSAHGFCRWAVKRTAAAAVFCGLAMGLLCLFRPHMLLVVAGMAGWMAWVCLRHAVPMRRALVCIVAMLGCAILAVAPAVLRNYAVSGEFVLVSSFGGVNAYIGNNAESHGDAAVIPDLEALTGLDHWSCFNYPELVSRLGEHLGQEPFGFSDASGYFYGRAAEFVIGQPVAALRLTLRKALLFWGPAEVSASKVTHFDRARSGVLHWLPGFPVVLGLGLLGVVLCCLGRGKARVVPSRSKTRSPGKKGTVPSHSGTRSLGTVPVFPGTRSLGAALGLLVFVGFYFLSVLPFFVAGRYRLPVIPFLMLFAGLAVARFVEYARGRQWRSAAGLVLAGVMLVGVAHVPWVRYAPSLGDWYMQRGLAHANAGRDAEAIAELERGVEVAPEHGPAWLMLCNELAEAERLDAAVVAGREAVALLPDNARAHNRLGYCHDLRGERGEAERHYRRAIALAPRLTLAHNNLGNLLLDTGRADDAIAHFDSVLALAPGDPHGRYNLGNAYRAKGAHREALRYYEEALATSPQPARVYNNMGLSYEALGETAEAEAAYGRAIAADSTFNLARNNLGNLLASLGRSDAAEAQYRSVVAADPADPYVHYNLGNLYGRLGRFADAEAAYLRAVEIAPGNPDILNNLGLLYSREKQTVQAEDCFVRLIAGHPGYARGYYNLGELRAGQGRFEEAVQLMEKAVALWPEFAAAQERLAAYRTASPGS